MTHGQFAEGSSAWAAWYAAGALPAEDRAAFEAHLAAGCPDCEAELRQLEPVIVALAGALKAAEPAPECRAALLRRVTAESKPAGSPLRRSVAENLASERRTHAMLIQRAAEAAWEKSDVSGVSLRMLFTDPEHDHFTALVRMAPGASYPRHIHHGPEECLVLEGDLHVGDAVLGPGDYQRAPVGSRHDVQTTQQGCLLLIISSLTDEFF